MDQTKHFFKVKFTYDTCNEGRRQFIINLKIFDVIDSKELHKQIDEYIQTRQNSNLERWYYLKVEDITKL